MAFLYPSAQRENVRRFGHTRASHDARYHRGDYMVIDDHLTMTVGEPGPGWEWGSQGFVARKTCVKKFCEGQCVFFPSKWVNDGAEVTWASEAEIIRMFANGVASAVLINGENGWSTQSVYVDVRVMNKAREGAMKMRNFIQPLENSSRRP